VVVSAMQSTGAYKKAPLGGRGGNSFQRQLRNNFVCKGSQKVVIELVVV
jgi:hypothetical protein